MQKEHCIHRLVCKHVDNEDITEPCENISICKHFCAENAPKPSGGGKHSGPHIPTKKKYKQKKGPRSEKMVERYKTLTTSYEDIAKVRVILKHHRDKGLLDENQEKALDAIGAKHYPHLDDIQKHQLLDILKDSIAAGAAGAAKSKKLLFNPDND